MHRVQVGPITVGGGGPLAFIAGPCVIESRQHTMDMAAAIREIAARCDVPMIFKASFDKANRTSRTSFRGPGLDGGLRILQEVRERTGLPVITDIHEPSQATAAADAVDVLQIPAFLCRQTDLIQAAGETGRAVNVKKGQFLAPWDVRNIAEKLSACGCKNFIFTERGTTFGYQNLVADMRSLYWMRELGYRVVMDATHSVQRPGGLGATTGGDGKLAPVLARAAVAAGCDGVFIETHVNPAEALSDGPNQVPLADLPALLRQLLRIHEIAKE